MQPIEDAGKNGWRVADFSVIMVAADLGPQQIGRTTIDCQISCHSVSFIAINHQTCDPHTSVHHDYSQMADRAKFTRLPIATPPTVYAYTLSSQITVVLGSIMLTGDV
ncbi:hypothetical protein TNCV_802691 [Trichonephila clavipes]|nr:hypothetical protein TNCV_802691 [Trichonephila clavipes]